MLSRPFQNVWIRASRHSQFLNRPNLNMWMPPSQASQQGAVKILVGDKPNQQLTRRLSVLRKPSRRELPGFKTVLEIIVSRGPSHI